MPTTKKPATAEPPPTSVVDTAITLIEDMNTEMAGLPHEDLEPVPRKREEIIARKQALLSRTNHLRMLLHAVETVPPSTPFSEWKAVLESLIGEMSNELQGIEADEKRVRDRREMDLKESIRLLNIGPEVNLGTSGEFMPTLLYDALQKRGITPDTNGQFFAPRGGGLRRVTERLAELRKRRVKAIVELEHYCHEYETQTA